MTLPIRHLNPLRAYRNDRGLSAAELAAAVGLSRSQLVAIESGQRTITKTQQTAIAARLSIDPAEIACLLSEV